MTTLDVERMTAAVHQPADDPSGRERVNDVERVLRRVAGQSLARRLSAAGLPAYGEWCVRRVATTLTWDEDTPSARLETEWVDALLAALGGSLARSQLSEPGASDASAGVVHYRHRDEAVLDLVVSLAAGRTERRWAWQQLGLLTTTPGDDRELVLTVLGRHPHLTLAAVRQVVATRGAAALHRLLGSAGWVELARLAATASGSGPTEAAGHTTIHRAPAMPGEREDHRAASPGPGTVAADSPVLRALGASGVRPDPQTARAWALLALLDADPAGLARADAPERLDALTEHLTAQGPPPRVAEPVRDHTVPSPMAHSHEHPETPDDAVGRQQALDPSDGRAGSRRVRSVEPDAKPEVRPGPDRDAEALSADPAPDAGTTAWGGLPFLLGAASAAGLPRILDDVRLVDRDTRWVVHRVAGLAADAEPHDPGRLALCGLPPSAPAPAGPEPSDAEQVALEEIWAAWSVTTHAALSRSTTSSYADLDVTSAIQRLVARTAQVRGEPGWLDVVLRLDEVDVDVRVAALDLDPGWVPWLGTVVRFHYE